MTISVKPQIQSLLQLPTTNWLFLIVSPRLDLTVLQPLIQRFSGHQLALFQSFSQPPTAADTLKAWHQYRVSKATVIAAVGGMDAISLANNLRVVANMNDQVFFLFPNIIAEIMKHLVVNNPVVRH
ncbi:hypothetical protein [Secundilactobacillus kimchicus]|uniref:hypothetical protein n=1 Tax=Secundilactobacillus kimchicus TaxID=528209 RepID=UPI0024A8ABAD|nr:hypothetical protein [Secundilactobacillus kimchicus]